MEQQNDSRHLLSVKLKEDYRCLKSGLEIELRPITLLVGDQGTGKSTLLDLLQKNHPVIELQLSDNVKKNGINHYYFNSETMNPRTSDMNNYTNPDGTSRGIGVKAFINSRFHSHGESLVQLTVDTIKEAENCVLLLDEPESGLSVRNQFKLAEAIRKSIERNVQVIAATHSLVLIEYAACWVYSMEDMEWQPDREFRINQQFTQWEKYPDGFRKN